jgi:hypothetical protein
MRVNARPASLLALFLAAVLAATPALARPPKAALDDRGDPSARSDDIGKGARLSKKEIAPGAYFNDRNREAVRAYYPARKGKSCPPGLARKGNGCLPPGQALKWHVGDRLPRDVKAGPVPHAVLVKLPRLPPGHKYVQVAGDILLVAIGSQMIVDGINGLAR